MAPPYQRVRGHTDDKGDADVPHRKRVVIWVTKHSLLSILGAAVIVAGPRSQ